MKTVHIQTPLLGSSALSRILDRQVYLKMEALQPVGSFKARGMGAACQAAKEAGYRKVICSSGGNAGLAVAYAGRVLGIDATIVVPESTSERARDLIRMEGADLIVRGESWQEAHTYALKLVESSSGAYIHPFDDPVVWDGHASIVPELHESGIEPKVIVVSVGGGGLLSGLLAGMHRVGWGHIPLIAVETEGADSFARAAAAGELVTLESIDTLATSLGAKTVCRQALEWTRRHEILPYVVSDRDAVNACLAFADDHRILVEPACGASLSLGYSHAPVLADWDPIVFIVCGGAGVTRELLEKWDASV